MGRLVLQAMHETQGVEWPSLIQAFVDINWLYFSFLLFVFTCALIWIVSQFTPKALGRAARRAHLQLGVGRAERRRPPELWFLGDFPHLRDRRNHRQHLHLLLVSACRLRYDATPADYPAAGVKRVSRAGRGAAW